MSKAAGFGSVSALLDKNPNATRPPPLPTDAAGGGAAAPRPRARSRATAGSGGGGGDDAHPASLRGRELEMVPDADLPPRTAPLPDAAPLAVHRPPRARGGGTGGGGGVAGGSTGATRAAAWPRGAPDALPLPDRVAPGDLAEVLEFVAAFGGGRERSAAAAAGARAAAAAAGLPTPPLPASLNIPAICPAVLAAELCAAPADGPEPAVDAPSSAGAALHISLLDTVRGDWGIPGTVGSDGWHAVMRSYLREDVRAQRAAGNVEAEEGVDEREEEEAAEEVGEAAAKAVTSPTTRRSGRKAIASPPQKNKGGAAAAAAAAAVEEEDDAATMSADGAVAGAAAAGDDEEGETPLEADPDSAYPAAGYWGLEPCVRIRMLRELVHDALDTGAARAQIEGVAECAGAADRAVREELAGARRDAKAAWAKQRDLHIGALLASATVNGGMTADEQRALVAETKSKVEAAASAAAAARVRALAARAARGGREVRALPLGRDRDGAAYYDLPGVTAALAGAGRPAILVCRPPETHPAGPVSPAALKAGAGPRRRGAAGDGPAAAPAVYVPAVASDGLWGAITDGRALAAALDGTGEGEGPLKVEVMARFGLEDEAPAAAVEAPAANAAGAPADASGAAAAPAEAAAAAPVPAAARGPAPRRGRPPKAGGAGAGKAAPKRGTKRAPKAEAAVADATATATAECTTPTPSPRAAKKARAASPAEAAAKRASPRRGAAAKAG